MSSFACPKCGTPNRAGARFCAKCRAPLTVAPTAPAYTPQQPSLAPAPQQPLPPAVAQAGATAARGCGAFLNLIARSFTLGGRSVYGDLLAPEPVAQGMIISPVDQCPAPAPIEAGCFVWAIAWIVIGLATWLFAEPGWGNPVFFIVFILVLLLFSWAGVRLLAFSRLTPNVVIDALTMRGRNAQNRLQFTMQTNAGHLGVTMVGAIKNMTLDAVPQQGHMVCVWGIRSGNTARVWKLQFLNTDGTVPPNPLTLSTARLLPLVAMLFFPSVTWFVIWLVITIVRALPH